MSQPLYVIDIDGTLADISHRVHLVSNPQDQDWATFFSWDMMCLDQPVKAAKSHFDERGYFIHGAAIFLTARISSTRSTTTEFLVRNGFGLGREPGMTFPKSKLIMKPDFMRKQRSTTFKVDVLKTLRVDIGSEFDLVLIEDYGAVRRAVDKLGFVRTLKAPDCWALDGESFP